MQKPLFQFLSLAAISMMMMLRGCWTHVFLLLITSLRCTSALFGRKFLATNARTRANLVRAGSSSSSTPPPPSPLGIVIEYDGADGPPDKALIVMDGFCPYHSGYLERSAREIPGCAIIHVLSDYMRGYAQSIAASREDWERCEDRRMPQTLEEAERWKASLGETTKIVAVYCESDSGLADAEKLRELLQVKCRDDPDVLEARRNKYLMLQKVAAESSNGLKVAKQKLCNSKAEARAFAQELLLDSGSDRVVCKPFRGVASESVHLCQSLDEVEDAWDKITATSIFGAVGNHQDMLVQEFLSGVEYAVDLVSRDGEHKVAAIWRYDKRPANGAAFCYFKTELVDSEMDESVEAVCDYIKGSLDALGVKFGLSHCEAIVVDDERGPMLIEVNCRQHNMDFCPLTMACIGYNALDMVLTALLGDGDEWMEYPDMPMLRAYGAMVHLVNYGKGRLKQYHHLQDMADLPSVFDCEVYNCFLTPGEVIEPTVDIRSDAGWAQLINPDPKALQQDYEQIVEWMPTMFETFDDD